MTPLYFDNKKGGLASRDGKLLECCCCEYCCNKFGTGGIDNPTILTSDGGGVDNSGNGNIVYLFTEDQCTYTIGENTQISSVYYLEIKITNNEISGYHLVLYCQDFPPGGSSYDLTPENPADITITNSCDGINLFGDGETIFSGGPCDHKFHAKFSCVDSNGQVEIWRV